MVKNLLINCNGEIFNTRLNKIELDKYIVLSSVGIKDSNKNTMYDQDIIQIKDEFYYIEISSNGAILMCLNNLFDDFEGDFNYFHGDLLTDLYYRYGAKVISDVNTYIENGYKFKENIKDK